MGFIRKMYHLLCFLEENVAVCLCAGMSIVTALQVFYRYVLSQPLLWTSELSNYCLVWLTFLGGSVVLRKKGHISISVFMHYMSERVNQITALIVNVIMAIAAIIAVWTSLPFIRMASIVPTITMGFSMGFVYGAFAVGFTLMLFHLIREIVLQTKSLRK